MPVLNFFCCIFWDFCVLNFFGVAGKSFRKRKFGTVSCGLAHRRCLWAASKAVGAKKSLSRNCLSFFLAFTIVGAQIQENKPMFTAA